MDDLQAKYDAVWPQPPRVPPPVSEVAKLPPPLFRSPPALRVIASDAGWLPECVRAGKPTLFMHLAGHFRSFALNAAHLRAFLDASSSCWFVVLFTLEFAEQRSPPWWCRLYDRVQRPTCLESAARAANTSVTAAHVREAALPLLHGTPNHGGLAFAVAARGHEPAISDTAVLQNAAAAAALSRSVLAQHRFVPHDTDIILHSRPDIMYSAAIDFAHLHRLSRRSALPLLLLLRHGGTAGYEGVNWNDPSDVAWVASRAAYDRLCPVRTSCLGARSAGELKRRSCGHAYASLFVHAAAPLGVRSLYVHTHADSSSYMLQLPSG